MYDDIYPNDSEALGIYESEPEIDDVLQAEIHQMASSYPIMDELIGWFTNKIDWYSSINAVEIEDDLDDYKITRQVMVNKLMTNLLTAKRDELALKFATYKQAMNPKPEDNDE